MINPNTIAINNPSTSMAPAAGHDSAAVQGRNAQIESVREKDAAGIDVNQTQEEEESRKGTRPEELYSDLVSVSKDGDTVRVSDKANEELDDSRFGQVELISGRERGSEILKNMRQDITAPEISLNGEIEEDRDKALMDEIEKNAKIDSEAAQKVADQDRERSDQIRQSQIESAEESKEEAAKRRKEAVEQQREDQQESAQKIREERQQEQRARVEQQEQRERAAQQQQRERTEQQELRADSAERASADNRQPEDRFTVREDRRTEQAEEQKTEPVASQKNEETARQAPESYNGISDQRLAQMYREGVISRMDYQNEIESRQEEREELRQNNETVNKTGAVINREKTRNEQTSNAIEQAVSDEANDKLTAKQRLDIIEQMQKNVTEEVRREEEQDRLWNYQLLT